MLSCKLDQEAASSNTLSFKVELGASCREILRFTDLEMTDLNILTICKCFRTRWREFAAQCVDRLSQNFGSAPRSFPLSFSIRSVSLRLLPK